MVPVSAMKTDAATLVLVAGEVGFFAIRAYYNQKVGKVWRLRGIHIRFPGARGFSGNLGQVVVAMKHSHCIPETST